MSTAAFMACVSGIAKRVSKDKLKKLEARHKEYHENLKAQGDPLADANAAQRVVDEYNYELLGKKRLEAGRIAWANQLMGDVSRANSVEEIVAQLRKHAEAIGGAARDAESYTASVKAHTSLAHKTMAEAMDAIGPNALGFRGKAKIASEANIVRELTKPGSTGDAGAAQWAKAWKETTDLMHEAFNLAGGVLAKLDDFWFPQRHTVTMLLRKGKDAYVNDHLAARMNWDAMIDHNGKSLGRATVAERRAALEYVYDVKTTDGANKAMQVGAKNAAVGNRMDEHRFLRYADADQWYEMHQKYGEGAIYDVMMNYIDDMAHDMAVIRSFSPSPQWGHDYAIAAARKRAAELMGQNPGKPLVQKVESDLDRFTRMFDNITRKNAAPTAGAGATTAHVMASLRQVQVGSKLGSTSLVAIPTDILGMARAQANISGIPYMRTLGRYLKLMNPLSSADRDYAHQSGVVWEMASKLAFTSARLNPFDEVGSSLARRYSDFVMRTSLMSWHTESLRIAPYLEAMGLFARNQNTQFADHPFLPMMQRYGITEAEYNAFRAITPNDYKGAKFLRPIDLLEQMPDRAEAMRLYRKFNGMLLEESTLFSPDSSIESAVSWKGSTRPGTLSGEMLRSIGLFKNFAVTQYFIHGRNMMMQHGLKGKMHYAGAFLIGLTLGGAMAEQMKALSNGKDFYNMDPTTPEGRKFWAQSFMTGGGLGFYGDVIFKDLNEFGRGTAEKFGGPVAGFIDDAINLTAGNISQAMDGKDTAWASEAIRMAYKNLMPDTWWNHLILKRTIYDTLMEMTDPKAASKIKKRETEMQKNYGQEMWWPEGQAAPQRAPAMSPR